MYNFDRIKFSRIFLISLSALATISLAHAADDSLVVALSARHLTTSGEDINRLEQIAGSEDKFVTRLLELRLRENLPFVPVRAEKILLKFSQRNEVLSALKEDLREPGRTGLARVIAIHLDQVSNAEARAELARVVAERASQEPDFLPYLQALKESRDTTVRQIARDALK